MRKTVLACAAALALLAATGPRASAWFEIKICIHCGPNCCACCCGWPGYQLGCCGDGYPAAAPGFPVADGGFPAPVDPYGAAGQPAPAYPPAAYGSAGYGSAAGAYASSGYGAGYGSAAPSYWYGR
jgi:hypothetical protein